MSEPKTPEARHLLEDAGAQGEGSSVLLAALRGARADVPDAAHVEALSRSIASAVGGGGAGGGGGGGEGGGGGGAGAGGAAAVGAAAGLGAGTKLALVGLTVIAALGVGVMATRGGAQDGDAGASANASAGASANASAGASASANASANANASAGASASASAGVDAGVAVVDVNALPEAVVAVEAGREARGGGSPEAEMTLLRSAQDALAGSPAVALARCDAHATAYPNGALAEEREVIAIDALLRLGRRREAEGRAARFRAAHPRSAYLRRLDTLLGD